jgi:hypothetical protein
MMQNIFTPAILLVMLLAFIGCEQVPVPPLERKPSAVTYFQDLADIHQAQSLDTTRRHRMMAFMEFIGFDSAFKYPDYDSLSQDADLAYRQIYESMAGEILKYTYQDSLDPDTAFATFTYAVRNTSDLKIKWSIPSLKVTCPDCQDPGPEYFYFISVGVENLESGGQKHFPEQTTFVVAGEERFRIRHQLFKEAKTEMLQVRTETKKIEFANGRLVEHFWEDYNPRSPQIPPGVDYNRELDEVWNGK